MSMSTEIILTCPCCQRQAPFVRHHSINVTLDPEAKHKVLSGELFHFVCPSCGEGTPVAYTALYHDMRLGLMVYLVPGEDEARNKMLDELGEPAPVAGAPLVTRAVAEFNELKEKIFVFDAGLDDRLVEVTKLLLQAQLQSQNDALRDSRFYFERVEGDRLGFAAVGERGVQRFSVPKAGAYTFMANRLAAAGVLAEPLGPWPLVGQQWAAWAIRRA